MREMLYKNCADPWYGYIASGKKKIEGRLFDGDWKTLQPDDNIKWYIIRDGFTYTHVSKIKEIKRYKTFKEMLEVEGLENVLPGVKTIEEGVSIYYSFPGFKEKEKNPKIGVIAIHLY
jgi:ASC-1-like (ASCH) protein